MLCNWLKFMNMKTNQYNTHMPQHGFHFTRDRHMACCVAPGLIGCWQFNAPSTKEDKGDVLLKWTTSDAMGVCFQHLIWIVTCAHQHCSISSIPMQVLQLSCGQNCSKPELWRSVLEHQSLLYLGKYVGLMWSPFLIPNSYLVKHVDLHS